MDIQQTSALLLKANNDENITYFNKYVVLYNLQQTTQLKELFDTINNDTVTWLKSLPKEAKSIHTLRKYKKPLIALLENDEIQDALGVDYCESVKTNINDTFSQIANDVSKERTNKKTININEKHNTHNINDNESCVGTETSEGLGIPIDELVVNKDTQHDNTDIQQETNNIDYKKQYEMLNNKYNQLSYKHTSLLEQYNQVTEKYNNINAKYIAYQDEIEFLRRIVDKLASR